MSRRAKIVCTLGPATSSQERITGLIIAGLAVAVAGTRLRGRHAIRRELAARRLASEVARGQRTGKPVSRRAQSRRMVRRLE